MNGWVIVYLPGGNIYQMLDASGPPGPKGLRTRILKHGLKAALTLVQLYWWIRS